MNSNKPLYKLDICDDFDGNFYTKYAFSEDELENMKYYYSYTNNMQVIMEITRLNNDINKDNKNNKNNKDNKFNMQLRNRDTIKKPERYTN